MSATRGLFAYNALAATFFVYLGVRHEFVGPLLWPAAALHAILAILLARILVLDAPSNSRAAHLRISTGA